MNCRDHALNYWEELIIGDCGLLSYHEGKVLYWRYIGCNRIIASDIFHYKQFKFVITQLTHDSSCLRMRQTSMSTREISVVYRDASRPVTRKFEFSTNGLAAGNVYLWGGRIDVVGIVNVSTFSMRAHLRKSLSLARIFPIPFLSRFTTHQPANFRKRIRTRLEMQDANLNRADQDAVNR